jgi:hypothetical protein
MSDSADRLAQALYDLINAAVQEAIARHLPAPSPAQAVERRQLPGDRSELCPWCNKKHMRHLMPVAEARQQLGGVSPTTFYALVKEANCRSLRSVAARSSTRKNSTISSGESGLTLPVKRKLSREPTSREQLVAEREDLQHVEVSASATQPHRSP